MLFNEVSASQNVVAREKETVKFWNENKIFERTVEEALSMVLTLMGGFIPARKAAKKDPVIALRSE